MIARKTAVAVLIAGATISGGLYATDVPPVRDSTRIELAVKDGSDLGGGGGFLMLRQLEELIDLQTFTNENATPREGANFCIYASGVGTNKFSVDLAVSGGDEGFLLKDGNNSIPYSVDLFNDVNEGGQKQGDTLTANGTQTISGLSNATINDSFECDLGTLNASVYVFVDPSDLSSAPAGDYTGNLTLTVSAN
ncbi:hypothetical protein [Endozoicomonas lisbonensis]|uniref:Spore coat protein U domain-containing protein n=2 Tax=Endozoicomonas lisbonensis TaxID=3120522 RepID=A0ABV2SG70_9GAMM